METFIAVTVLWLVFQIIVIVLVNRCNRLKKMVNKLEGEVTALKRGRHIHGRHRD
jgi:hypothetical protein